MVDPFHPKASGASFAGFQGSSRAEAAGNEEEEDDRLEDQHLVMSRLACTKVRGVICIYLNRICCQIISISCVTSSCQRDPESLKLNSELRLFTSDVHVVVSHMFYTCTPAGGAAFVSSVSAASGAAAARPFTAEILGRLPHGAESGSHGQGECVQRCTSDQQACCGRGSKGRADIYLFFRKNYEL